MQNVCCFKRKQIVFKFFSINKHLFSTLRKDKSIQECCEILKIPLNSKQDEVKAAFLELAKKYHPDSGSPLADETKFVIIENAFRQLTKHNTGSGEQENDQLIFDIKHTAPQHRQYLNFDGIGHGTPYQRQKQWEQARAQRAAANVLEHRVNKAITTDNALMKNGQHENKHDIKTKYGFDRLVEDLIQESMSRGEFENLNGKGKPLKEQNTNPFVDFTTHKLNEVLINNGFTPEWITMNKDIDNEIELLKEELAKERMPLGQLPLSCENQIKWNHICIANKKIADSINKKINTYNLIVPLMNKQRFHVEFEKICEEILTNGKFSDELENINVENEKSKNVEKYSQSQNGDLFGALSQIFIEILNFRDKKNVGS